MGLATSLSILSCFFGIYTSIANILEESDMVFYGIMFYGGIMGSIISFVVSVMTIVKGSIYIALLVEFNFIFGLIALYRNFDKACKQRGTAISPPPCN
jgi:hypothetical protein